MPSRNGNESDSLGVVSDLLDEVGGFLDNFIETLLAPLENGVRTTSTEVCVGKSYLGGVHLVNGNDELLDTKGEGEQGMLSGLTILGDTGLELTGTGGNDEDSTISLGGTGNHVLDEVTVSRGVNDLGSFDQHSAPNPDQRRRGLTVTLNLGVSNFQRAISIVIPRSRSALSLSKTQANWEERFQFGVLSTKY